MQPLRIAHLIETDGPGGAERIVVQIATMLQSSATHNVVFVPAKGEGWIAQQLTGSGVATEPFTIDRPFSPSCARGIAASFQRLGIDVAHSHEFSMAVYGGWAAHRTRVPHVITMHGSRYYAGRLRRRLAMRAAIATSGRTVAVSAQLKGEMCSDLWVRHERIRVVTNGVMPAAPGPISLREELGLRNGDRLLVAVGNLYPVKGHRYLVEAVARLSERHPNLHVALCGRGALADELTALSRTLRVDDRIHLLGLRGDVAAVLAAADIFVMPSVNEGLPLALLEAMFAGRPIVATNVGEVSRVLADGEAGAIVPPAHAEDLAAAIDRLLTDPDRARRLGEQAQSRARERYHVSRMVARYFRIYQALLRRQRGSRALVHSVLAGANRPMAEVNQ